MKTAKRFQDNNKIHRSVGSLALCLNLILIYGLNAATKQ